MRGDWLAGISDRLLDRRNALIRSPRFQRLVLRFPISRWIARRKTRKLFGIATGFVQSQVLYACISMGLLDQLDRGAQSITDLSSALDLAPNTTRQLLNAAAALDLVSPRQGDRYALGELGAAALANSGVDALVLHHDHLYRDLADPAALLRRGIGERSSDYWPYTSSDDPEQIETSAVTPYTELMARSQQLIATDVLDSVSLAGRQRLLDLGGGAGIFAEMALSRWPTLHATVFDLPGVVPLATRTLENHGHGSRSNVHPGNLFKGLMPTGFDAVSLVRVVHDHDDEAVLCLLRRAATALVPGGQLLIAEPLAGPDPDGAIVSCYFNIYLLAMGSGRPRTVKEITYLLEKTGFSNIQIRSTPRPLIVRVITAIRSNK